LSGGPAGTLGKEAVQYFQEHPSEIARALAKYYDESREGLTAMTRRLISDGASATGLGGQTMPGLATQIRPEIRKIAQWIDGCPVFCKEFGLPVEIDFALLASNPQITGRVRGFDALVYTPKGLTIGRTLAICRKQFPVWVEPDSRLRQFSLEGSLAETGLVLCRPRVPVDNDWIWKSPDEMSVNASVRFLDIRERYMLEAFYFWLTKQLSGTGMHLDTVTSTRCPRSRDPLHPQYAAAAYYDSKYNKFWAFAGNATLTDRLTGGRQAIPVSGLAI
jgi:hypothetical protein